MLFAIGLVFAAACAVAGYVIVQRRGGQYSIARLDLDNMPTPSPRWLVGHTEMLAPDFHRVLSGWAEMLGTIYRIKVFGQDGVVVSDPAIVAHLLGHDDTELPKHAVIYQVLDQVRRYKWRCLSACSGRALETVSETQDATCHGVLLHMTQCRYKLFDQFGIAYIQISAYLFWASRKTFD